MIREPPGGEKRHDKAGELLRKPPTEIDPQRSRLGLAGIFRYLKEWVVDVMPPRRVVPRNNFRLLRESFFICAPLPVILNGFHIFP